MRPRRPVDQTGLAIGHIAVPPLRDRAPRQAHLAGHMRLGHPPSTLRTINKRPTGVKGALACDIEPPVFVSAVINPHSHRRLTHRAATNLYVQNI